MSRDLVSSDANSAWRLPSCCKVCQRWCDALVCRDCLHQFAPARHRCRTCAVGLISTSQERCGGCLSIGTPIEACHAAVDYAYPWDAMLQRFKYSDGGDLSAQPELAKSMASVARHVAQQDAAFARAFDAAYTSDWLIPIALHPERQRQRGFNQAHAFAQALLPKHPRLRTDLLLRIKNTAVQARLPRDAREHNMRGAFIIAPLSAHLLQGSRVTLIDDVTTTSATLVAAAQVLMKAGAREIHAVVFARAV
jgi:ComF family protein